MSKKQAHVEEVHVHDPAKEPSAETDEAAKEKTAAKAETHQVNPFPLDAPGPKPKAEVGEEFYTFGEMVLGEEGTHDFVIHNACQTVRRPSGFYGHLMDGELAPSASLSSGARSLLADYDALRDSATRKLGNGAAPEEQFAVGLHAAPVLSQVALTAADREAGPLLFPSGQLDADHVKFVDPNIVATNYDLIGQGKYTAAVLQTPQADAEFSFKVAVRVAEGVTVPKENYLPTPMLDKSNVGQYPRPQF